MMIYVKSFLLKAIKVGDNKNLLGKADFEERMVLFTLHLNG